MSLEDSSKIAHLQWIDRARRQVDEADIASGDVGAAVRAHDGALLDADFFPGYELQREIHRGGQGVVYRAIQKNTNRRVAVKLLHDSALGTPLERARFEREMHILAALQHPNIVAIHDGGSHNGRFFLVMDYIEGMPLDLYLAGRPHTIEETLRLFLQICDAVHNAHLRGIIHRDIKPANVRIDGSGRAFVLDFGLAKFAACAHDTVDIMDIAAHTLTGQFLGSLPWAAPEQVDSRSAQVDTRTDVYSLGVLLFQMLTAKFPYPVAGPMKEAMEAILHADPLSPRELRIEVDDELSTIVLKCLSKEPERRYQTAGELAQDIHRYLKGEPIDAKRESAVYVLRKTLRRYRVPLGVVATFVLLMAVFSGVTWTLWGQADQAARAARVSESAAQERLRESLIAQARAARHTGRIGQRFDSLDALSKAAAIEPTIEARNEAIAAMTLPDLRHLRTLTQPGVGCLDPHFERCAVVAADGSVTLVQLADDMELGQIPAPSCGFKQIHGAQISGHFFVRLFDPPVGSRRLEVWDIVQGRLHLEFTDVPDMARFDISSDGQRLAIGRLDQAIHIIDLESGAELQCVSLDRIPSYLGFDASGRKLVLYHNNYKSPRILDLQSGGTEAAFESKDISFSVAWHPDGHLLAGAAGARVEVWDAQAHRTLGFLNGHEAQVICVRFSHDGKLLLTQSWDGQAALWDVRTRRLLLRFLISGPDFSSDDQQIAGTVVQDLHSRVKVFELNHALERRCLMGLDDPDAFATSRGAFDPTSGLLFTSTAGSLPENSGLHVFDVVRGREVARSQNQPMLPLSVDSRGSFLLTGNDGSYRWPLRRKARRLTIGPPVKVFSTQRVNALDVSPDGKTAIVSCAGESEFSIFDLDTHQEAHRYMSEASGICEDLRISPDGSWVAIAGKRNSIAEVWDLRTGILAFKLTTAFEAGLAFSVDSRLLVSSGAEGLSIWEVGSWRLVRVVPGQSSLLKFSPDGRILASLNEPSTLQLLDGETFQELATLEPPESYKTGDLEFSLNGALLAQITNRAGIVHVWDLRRIRERLQTLGLDWNLPFYEPVDARSLQPVSVEIESPDQNSSVVHPENVIRREKGGIPPTGTVR